MDNKLEKQKKKVKMWFGILILLILLTIGLFVFRIISNNDNKDVNSDNNETNVQEEIIVDEESLDEPEPASENVDNIPAVTETSG